ncbi:unnamed protein product [Rhizophagus irregularis]|nr:unnamed protein product [Rhizophagus irregularis]
MLRLEESDTKNTLKVLLDDETLRTIHRYEPQDFKDLTEIASGASAFVYYGRKNTSKFAIKKFKNPKEEAIIKEIHLMGIVSPHPNIITFYGVTKLDETNYSLVLEYADKTLRNYLRDDAIPFKWESQLNFAREIANAISWLHDDKEIIHGDLHPNNILINDENPIPKTNDRFVSLYKKCWQHEPDERPPICQVIEELDSIDPIINNLPTNSNKSKITQDKDSDLNITTYSK